jgi:PIN domain nuclease of toxin-antitoxin system
VSLGKLRVEGALDRLLVAQALEEDLVTVTADPVFAKYGVNRIW